MASRRRIALQHLDVSSSDQVDGYVPCDVTLDAAFHCSWWRRVYFRRPHSHNMMDSWIGARVHFRQVREGSMAMGAGDEVETSG